MTNPTPPIEKRGKKITAQMLFEMVDLKIVPIERKRLICGNCGGPPHWFGGKACTLEIQARYCL